MGIDDHSRIAFAGIMPDHKKRSAPPKVPRRRGFGRGQRIFLCAPLRGLVRTALSDYWRLRSRLGLTRHGEAAMIEKLGFATPRPYQYQTYRARRAYHARPR
jgi:hypothetical protein